MRVSWRSELLCAILTASVFIGPSPVSAEPGHTTYLLRMARENSSGSACVLLDNAGAFHYEDGDFERTRVYEGQIRAKQLSAIQDQVEALSTLSQSEIGEPVVPSGTDLLDIHIFRDDKPKELLFRSPESQQDHADQISPLLRWMSTLPKLSSRQLTEDQGKRNCLPRRKLVLRRRNEVSPQVPLKRTPLAGRRIAPPPAAPAPSSAPASPLLQYKLLQKTSSTADEKCLLVARDGQYRFERRLQKIGKSRVDDSLAHGYLSAHNLEQLHTILSAPRISGLGHREPPGGMPLNIMGTVLELTIQQPSRVQELILTDSQRRTTFFFPGDGDIRMAEPLLNFVRAGIENSAAPAQAKELNGCRQLP